MENRPTRSWSKLRIDPRTVGQNLRAIRRRHGKRLAMDIQRQRADSLAYYEAIYREALSGWRRSQNPKNTTTHTKERGDLVKEVERIEDGLGTCAFLATAMYSRKAIDAIFAGKPVKYHRSIGVGPPEPLLTKPPELSKLNDEEFARVVAIAKGIAHDRNSKTCTAA